MAQRTFFTALLVSLVVFQFAPSATTLAGAATVCNWAMFVADVTVPDGSLKAPGEAFTKTWRIKNIGSCTWSTSYSAVFSDGDSLGAPASVPLPKSVAPGINVDISVSMSAPSASGHYRGNWKLKDAGGNAFGIGASASNPFWVDILVASGNGAVVDLAANACSAKWISGVGLLPCPGTDGASSGFVLPVSNPTLEDGSVDPLPGLLVFPQNKFDGYIQGFYPYYTVQNGDHFQAAVGCANGSACLVTYRLDYQAVEGGVLHILWQWKEANDGKIFNLDYDLSALAGKSVRFVLTVLASGPASGDRAVWAHPRIVGAGAPTATPPPTGSVTNVVVTAASVTDASCGGPNVTGFHGEITTNGAAEVTYHWEVGGDKTSISTDEQRSFPAAGTQTFDTDAYKADCGNYFARLVVTSPNAISAQASFIIAAQPPSPTEPTATEPPPTSTPQAGTALDFTADLCSAKWISGAGLLPCPMIDGDVRGFALRADNPVLENGSTEGLPAIIVSPQKKTDGYIQGFYPYYTVQPGDHFQAAVGCANGSPCNVIYRLDYQSVEGGVLHILWKWNETADNHIFNLDFDLSALAGKRVRFVLTLLANGPVTGDRAIWAHPRIVGTGAPTITAGPGATDTPTPIPPTETLPTDTPPTGTTPSATPSSGSALDFAGSICSAKWQSGAGVLPCPMTDGDVRGFALRADNPVLETGAAEGLPGLIIAPQNKTDGYLQGFYPYYTVQPGDHFQAAVGCANGSPCLVTFRLDYQSVEGGVLHILWTWKETSDGKIFNLDYSLNALAGRNVRFVLTLLASGSPAGDRAIWAHPRIVHTDDLPPTPSPTPVPPTVLRGKVINADVLSCRYGPGPMYLYLYGLNRGAVQDVIGRTDTGQYLLTRAAGDTTKCWVNATYLQLNGDVMGLDMVYPDKYTIPQSNQGYRAPWDVAAVRVGNQVVIDWKSEALRPGDEESPTSPLYVVEAWVCRSGRVTFTPIGASTPLVNVVDEPGCAEPSHGRVYFAEKHGYAGPSAIPWPAPAASSTSIQVYFYQNQNSLVQGQSLPIVPVQRLVDSTDLPQAALTQLFEGPSADEQAQGLALITNGVTGFSSLTLADGIASVSLTGDCNAQGSSFTIADLIRATLTQFPQIQHVRIYDRNGSTGSSDPGTDSTPACLEP